MKNKRSGTIQIFTMVIVYKFILEYAYTNIVSKYWGYWFPKGNQDIVKYFFTWLLVLLPLAILKFHKETLSNYTLNTLYLINYIPGCILLGYSSVDIQYMCMFCLFWGTLMVLNLVIPYFSPHINGSHKGKVISEIELSYFCFVIIGIWIIYAGARMRLALSDIYSARMEARSYNMPVFLAYVFSFAKSLIRVSILVNLCKRKWKESIALTGVGIIVYLIEGSKEALFSVFLVWLIWLAYYIITKDKIWLYIIGGLNALGMGSIILIRFFNLIAPSSYFFQRLLFLPSVINMHYYIYFKGAEKDFFRQSIVGKITGMKSPYNMELPRLMGKYIFNNSETNANTGLIGDAYANLGFIGIIAMPIFIILLLRLIDLCMKGLPSQIYIFMGIIMSVTLLSNSFFTILLSNGVVIIILYLLLTGKEKRKKTKKLFIKITRRDKIECKNWSKRR